MNKDNNIKFEDGTPLTHVDSATYLGGKLTKDVNPITEIQNRISACMPILKSLDLFWKKTNCDLKWKLNVHNAVIVSKLTYGLETLQYTYQVGQKLNTFQMKGIRKIMKIPPTHIDRSWTNQRVYDEANKEIDKINAEKKKTGQPGRLKIRPITELIDKRKIKLLGHIIRADRNDPLQEITFSDPINLTPLIPAYKRVGKPRIKWVDHVMGKAWNVCRGDDNTTPLTGTPEQIEKIKFHARRKIKLF